MIAVPLLGDRAAVLREVSRLMDEALQGAGSDASTAQFKFLVNKIRRRTLDNARRVAWARAAAPKQPLYVIGNRVKIDLGYITEEGAKALKDNRRELMVIVTSRHLHRALVFSENAARGRFPCSDEVDSIDFDFKQVQSSIITHRNWIKAELTRLKRLQSATSATDNETSKVGVHDPAGKGVGHG